MNFLLLSSPQQPWHSRAYIYTRDAFPSRLRCGNLRTSWMTKKIFTISHANYFLAVNVDSLSSIREQLVLRCNNRAPSACAVVSCSAAGTDLRRVSQTIPHFRSNQLTDWLPSGISPAERFVAVYYFIFVIAFICAGITITGLPRLSALVVPHCNLEWSCTGSRLVNRSFVFLPMILAALVEISLYP